MFQHLWHRMANAVAHARPERGPIGIGIILSPIFAVGDRRVIDLAGCARSRLYLLNLACGWSFLLGDLRQSQRDFSRPGGCAGYGPVVTHSLATIAGDSTGYYLGKKAGAAL